VVGFLEARLFLLQLFLNLPPLYGVDEGSFDVGPFHHPGVPFFLWPEILPFHQLIELIVLCVPHDLFGVVLQQFDQHRLFPDGLLKFFDPLGDGHLFFGLLEGFEQVAVPVLQ
jgi:hypothetical protein